MKICYIITKADEIGGAQVHVRDLAVSMRDLGHQVSVITGEDGELVKQLRSHKIEVLIDTNLKRAISPVHDIKAFYSLRKKISNLKPDILTLHSSKAGILGRLVGCSLSVPTIFTVHGWAFAEGIGDRKRNAYIKIERFFAKHFTDHIITVSEQDRQLALKYNVASESLMTTVHNGISNPVVGERPKPAESKPINLIMVARFSEQKDHQTLFKALARIDKSLWKLKLVGKGKLFHHYQTLAEELGIADNIDFLGERNDVYELLTHSDIFLLISNWEGYPLSTLEAMACGLPIIASDVGGTNEAIKDHENGFLVPRKDDVTLSDKLEKLINDPELRSKISQKNKEDFAQLHTLEKMVSNTFDVYSTVHLTSKKSQLAHN